MLDNLEQLARGTADHRRPPRRVPRRSGARDEPGAASTCRSSRSTPSRRCRRPTPPSCSCSGLVCASPGSSRTTPCSRSPTPRRPAARARARRRPHQGAHAGADPRAARPEPGCDRGRPGRPAGAAAHAAGDDRLELRPPRRRTSRRSSDGSGVFAGSFDLDAAEAVGGGDLDTLASLVDKSLLRPPGDGRFAMLQVLREYARDRLEAAGETHGASLRARVVLPSARRADRAGAQDVAAPGGDRSPRGRSREFRAARSSGRVEAARPSSRSISSGGSGTCGGIAAARGGCWRERVLAAAADATDAGARERSPRRGRIGVGVRRSGAGPSRSTSRRSRCTSDLDEPVRVATTQVSLGTTYQAGSVDRTAARLLERGLAGLQAAGDEYGAAIATGNLSDLALQEGDFAAAARLSEQAASRPASTGSSSSKPCRRATRRSRSPTMPIRAPPRPRRSALRLCARTKLAPLDRTPVCSLVAAAIATEGARDGRRSPRSRGDGAPGRAALAGRDGCSRQRQRRPGSARCTAFEQRDGGRPPARSRRGGDGSPSSVRDAAAAVLAALRLS